MEKSIEKGAAVSEIAEASSNAADTEGITGFMYGCAVNLLARFWVHGEALRAWHNQKYGYEGVGTVNPAILSIGDNGGDAQTMQEYPEKTGPSMGMEQ